MSRAIYLYIAISSEKKLLTGALLVVDHLCIWNQVVAEIRGSRSRRFCLLLSRVLRCRSRLSMVGIGRLSRLNVSHDRVLRLLDTKYGQDPQKIVIEFELSKKKKVSNG